MKLALALGIVLAASQIQAANVTTGVKCFIAEDVDGDTSTQICIDPATGAASLVPLEEAHTLTLMNNVDTLWIIICGAMVFFMQVGFGILEAGCISERNVINIMFKNVMDASIAGISYWLVGYGFAYGNDKDGPFIGTANFALTEEAGDTFHSWFFQWAFAATAATIVAGSVAERCTLEAYMVYSVILTAFIYPVVSHWIWDTEGWLSVGNAEPFMGGNGMIDFAGCGVVHMVGGLAGLVAAIIIGPRKGRFDSTKNPHQPHNVLFCGVGVLFLWFGWYGFNCGSTLGITGNSSVVAARVATTTTIAAATGCITACIMSKVFWGTYDLLFVLNGILAGLVSITSACFCVDPWAAMVIAIIGVIVYKSSSMLLVKFKIDDPLDAAPVHGFCGAWGALTPGIFSSDALIKATLGNDADHFSTGKQFLTQLIGVLAVIAWVVATATVMFLGIKYTIGLRVGEEQESEGLDISEHGASAYVTKETEALKKTVADA